MVKVKKVSGKLLRLVSFLEILLKKNTRARAIQPVFLGRVFTADGVSRKTLFKMTCCFLGLCSVRKLDVNSKIQLFYRKLEKGTSSFLCTSSSKKPRAFIVVSLLPVQEDPVVETEGGGQ